MRLVRGLWVLAVAGLAAVAPPATAQDKPAVVLRVKPVDEILADAKFIAKGLAEGGMPVAPEVITAGFEQVAVQTFGNNWRKAIDTTKPLGMYAIVTEDVLSGTAVIMLPVPDQKAFLGVLKRANIDVDEKDGVYTFTPPVPAPVPVPPVSFRFANGYAYATFNGADHLAKDKLLAPDAVLAGKPSSLVELTLHVERVPENLRTLAAGQVEALVKNGLPGVDTSNMSEFQKKQFETSLKQLSDGLGMLLKDGKSLVLGIDIDRKTGEMGLDMGVTGKPGSALVKEIAKVEAGGQSKLAGLAGGDAAVRLVYNARSPDGANAMPPDLIEAGLRENLEKLPDEDSRKALEGLVKPLAKAFDPTAIDVAFALRGPSGTGRYTLVGGFNIKNGKGLEKAVIDTVGKLTDEQKARFQLAPAGGVHKVKLGDVPEKVQAVFGDGDVSLVIRDDAVVIAYGAESGAAVKAAPAAVAVTPFQLDVTISRLLPLVKLANPAAAEKLEEVFGKESESVKLLTATMDKKADGVTFRYGYNLTAVSKLIGLGASNQMQLKNDGEDTPKPKKKKVKAAD